MHAWASQVSAGVVKHSPSKTQVLRDLVLHSLAFGTTTIEPVAVDVVKGKLEVLEVLDVLEVVVELELDVAEDELDVELVLVVDDVVDVKLVLVVVRVTTRTTPPMQS